MATFKLPSYNPTATIISSALGHTLDGASSPAEDYNKACGFFTRGEPTGPQPGGYIQIADLQLIDYITISSALGHTPNGASAPAGDYNKTYGFSTCGEPADLPLDDYIRTVGLQPNHYLHVAVPHLGDDNNLQCPGRHPRWSLGSCWRLQLNL